MEVIYTAFVGGVFIQDIYGNLYTADEWDGSQTANGVAVQTENSEFVIALKYPVTGETIKMYVNNTVYDDLPAGLELDDAKNDYDGQGNTEKLLAVYGESTEYAAGACTAYIMPNGTKNCYIPSLGEMYDIVYNMNDVNSALSACGSTIDFSSVVWTSSRKTENIIAQYWAYMFNSLTANGYSAANTLKAIAISPLISPSDIIEFTIESTTYKCVKGTTWANWCSSAFNTAGYKVGTFSTSTSVILNSGGTKWVGSSSFMPVSVSGEISEGTKYVLASEPA